jgi:hypothetical protein
LVCAFDPDFQPTRTEFRPAAALGHGLPGFVVVKLLLVETATKKLNRGYFYQKIADLTASNNKHILSY